MEHYLKLQILNLHHHTRHTDPGVNLLQHRTQIIHQSMLFNNRKSTLNGLQLHHHRQILKIYIPIFSHRLRHVHPLFHLYQTSQHRSVSILK